MFHDAVQFLLDVPLRFFEHRGDEYTYEIVGSLFNCAEANHTFHMLEHPVHEHFHGDGVVEQTDGLKQRFRSTEIGLKHA